MFFIVGDNVDALLTSVGYNSSWTNDQLISVISPIVQESATNHAGFFFNPRYLDNNISYPLFRTEAFNLTGFQIGIWFQDTPNIPGGPDTCLTPGLDLYSLLEETPTSQLTSNQGIIFSGTEFATYYAGYLTGAMYRGRDVANAILIGLGKPPIATTYLNAPFPLTGNGISNFTLPTAWLPDDLNYVLYQSFSRIDNIANKYSARLYNRPDNDPLFIQCMTEMIVEINKIAAENKIDPLNPVPEFIPYSVLQQLLGSQIGSEFKEKSSKII